MGGRQNSRPFVEVGGHQNSRPSVREGGHQISRPSVGEGGHQNDLAEAQNQPLPDFLEVTSHEVILLLSFSLWSITHLVYQEVRGGAGDAGEGVRGEGGVAQCPGGGEGPAEFGARDSEPSPDPQSSSPPTSHVHVIQHVLQHVHSHSVYLSLQQTVGQLRVVQKQLPCLLRILLNAPLHLLH